MLDLFCTNCYSLSYSHAFNKGDQTCRDDNTGNFLAASLTICFILVCSSSSGNAKNARGWSSPEEKLLCHCALSLHWNSSHSFTQKDHASTFLTPGRKRSLQSWLSCKLWTTNAKATSSFSCYSTIWNILYSLFSDLSISLSLFLNRLQPCLKGSLAMYASTPWGNIICCVFN